MGNISKFALLGYGNHAQKAIIPAFKNSSIAEISHVSTSKSAEFRSYQDAIESSEIDSVFIALPNSIHPHWTTQALAAGKNVICEKPLCYNSEQANEIIASQKKSNTKLLEAFMYRFHPQHKIVKKMLSDGIIGAPRLYQAHFHYYLDNFENIRMNPELGGGALLDVGCYLIDSCLFLFQDRIKEITGNWIINKRANVDEFTTATLKFGSGMIANLTCGSRLTRQSSYCIYGELGKITVRNAFKIPKNKKGLIVLEKINGEKTEFFSEPADHYQLMIEEFCTKEINENKEIITRAELIEAWRNSCLSS